MFWSKRVLLLAVLVVCAAINGAYGSAMVTGTVFCDQCKDGHVTLLDYPLNGVKVKMVCPGTNNQMEMVGEETTSMLGSYTMRFDGSPDLSACYTQVTVTGGNNSSSCQASAGPAHSLSLVSSFFGMEFYSVDALLSQPARPMSFCSPPPAVRSPPPAVASTPPAKSPRTPVFSLPFLEASACSHEYWVMPKYRCHWRVVKPDMKVGLLFGPLAANEYGGDMTLWVGLQGRADPYKTLLREAITALLNSYNTLHFPYTSLQVVHRLNMALTAPTNTSTITALQTALSFKRANSGYGNANSSCKFKSCE